MKILNKVQFPILILFGVILGITVPILTMIFPYSFGDATFPAFNPIVLLPTILLFFFMPLCNENCAGNILGITMWMGWAITGVIFVFLIRTIFTLIKNIKK